MQWLDCVGLAEIGESPAHADSFTAMASATMIVVTFVNEQTLICVAGGSSVPEPDADADPSLA